MVSLHSKGSKELPNVDTIRNGHVNGWKEGFENSGMYVDDVVKGKHSYNMKRCDNKNGCSSSSSEVNSIFY